MDAPTPQESKKPDNGVGPMVGIVIVVLVLLLGGIYFLLTETSKNEQTPNTEQASL